SMFSASGGPLTTGSQILTYTGVSADAAKGTVAGGVPKSPGSLTAAAASVGGVLPNGTYGYKLTCVNANGDESEPGTGSNGTVSTVSTAGAPSASIVSN